MDLTDGKDVIDVWREGAATVIRMNRARVHNALDRQLIGALQGALAAVEDDRDVRAVVLTGAGASFCAGDDLNTVREADAGTFRASIDDLQDLTARLLRLETPVICAFNGPAFGAGLELALACDMRLATPDFVCSTPEVNLGLIATNASTVLLPALVGSARARRMLFTGARMDAAWCLEAGLVDELVAPANLMTRALDLAMEVAAAGPGAVAATRRLLNGALRAQASSALKSEAELCVAARESTEGREGVAAYFEGRAPAWRT